MQYQSLIFIFIFFVSCSSEKDESENSSDQEVLNNINYDISGILEKFDTREGFSYSIDNNNITFNTDNLPNHTSPYWPTSNNLYEEYNGSNSNFRINPNKIEAQNISITVPKNPSESIAKSATSLGAIGVARNGVVFYNQYAGPNNQPLTNEINSFDQWLGHPTGQSAYHYHIEPLYLTRQYGDDSFLGLLADGFPVYGPVENGENVTNNDLDSYHGHLHMTDDFKDGIYHYHITSEDPYINGNGFYGTPGNISN